MYKVKVPLLFYSTFLRGQGWNSYKNYIVFIWKIWMHPRGHFEINWPLSKLESEAISMKFLECCIKVLNELHYSIFIIDTLDKIFFPHYFLKRKHRKKWVSPKDQIILNWFHWGLCKLESEAISMKFSWVLHKGFEQAPLFIFYNKYIR